jgi:putative ABC transport system ATP-binding protein
MEDGKIIETIDLTKIYGQGDAEVIALDRVNLTIRAGEFVAIMGPSGSGKSTLLNLLACMDRPTGGRYLLAGEDVSDYTRKELAMIRSRNLGFVFQSFNLLQRATALDNVILPMVYRRENRVSIADRKDMAMTALKQVGLAERAHHMPNQLSGGQQQRVAIARALINEPALLLADEPTGNLDTCSSLEIMSIFENLNAMGRTVVIVTHEADIAHHTRRIIQVRDGQVYLDSGNGASATQAADIHAPSAAAAALIPQVGDYPPSGD